jgi:hypothetical protein
MTSLSRTGFPVRAAAAALTVTALLGLAACTGSSGAKPSDGSSGAPSTPAGSSSASTTPSRNAAAGTVNPLTGIGPVPKSPLIVVKIDDTAPGRPQLGIDKADIVYLEAVEAGYTRLAALFGTNKPTVGYVRSTRPSDPDLLRQYGKITEAFSGGQAVSRNLAKKAGLNTWSFGAGKPGFQRISRSGTTYINVEVDLKSVAADVKSPRPTSNGWTFGSSLTGLKTSTGTDLKTTVTGTYPVGSGTPVEFKYDPKIKKYVRYIDGEAQHAADGNLITATNVIVQSCEVHSFDADRDVNGYPAQFTTTIGTGPVSVFRQGKRINGTWSRHKVTSGTSLLAAKGKRIPLEPGNTWVVLIRKGVPVTG